MIMASFLQRNPHVLTKFLAKLTIDETEMVQRHTRGISLVEIGVTIAVIGILILVIPRGLAAIQYSAEYELQKAVAHKLAEGALASILNDDYTSLYDTSGQTVGTAQIRYDDGDSDYTVEYRIERQIQTDTSLGAGKEFKKITVRVVWPNAADGTFVGSVVKASLKSED